MELRPNVTMVVVCYQHVLSVKLLTMDLIRTVHARIRTPTDVGGKQLILLLKVLLVILIMVVHSFKRPMALLQDVR